MLVSPVSPSKSPQAHAPAREALRAMAKTNEGLRQTISDSRATLEEAYNVLAEARKCLARGKD